MTLISWIWCPISGFLSIVLLVISWGSVFGILFAIIGFFRKRTPFYTFILYFTVGIVSSFLFRGIFWISDRIATPDGISTLLFWLAVGIFGLAGLTYFPRLLAQLWQSTNSITEM